MMQLPCNLLASVLRRQAQQRATALRPPALVRSSVEDIKFLRNPLLLSPSLFSNLRTDEANPCRESPLFL
ncbi:protein WHAT'S THIS FACTOR 9, mitochondrial-like [Salvia divinorum]|uniref:Protein WHAT'S THIS FACTOR 9, mitochondrial-like n=1 Tax=Salvia divinorum TaxID=28513 RepID=A0ABD1I0G3_SALDI